jgi:hypothetical protein
MTTEEMRALTTLITAHLDSLLQTTSSPAMRPVTLYMFARYLLTYAEQQLSPNELQRLRTLLRDTLP